MRQIVLDTETTGIDPRQGHRVIEIGCVEMVRRRLTGRHYHVYINPDREVEAEAISVHGITNEFLQDKPRFAEIAAGFLEFVDGAELIIHNAPFDVGFLNHEFSLLGGGFGRIEDHCGVIDTLVMARQKHPGQKNNLDALCRRYMIDNSHRELHGALLDSEILAEVYLAMTGGQTSLSLSSGDDAGSSAQGSVEIQRLGPDRPILPVINADADALSAHQQWLERLEKKGHCLWNELDA